MKGKKGLERPQSYKVLEGEAEKLKDKLEGLRQQIKAKKQEKEMNKTMQSIYSNKQPAVTTASTQKDDSLFKLTLVQIKIEAVEQKLRDKGVTNLQLLMACTQQDIDQWKDIPVGYRIKLKKHIEKNRQKSAPSFDPTSKNTEFKSQNHEKDMDIEQIIKHRKAQQKFVPLSRKTEEEIEYQQQLEEADQEKMMLSILEAFSIKQRTSCLKKGGKTSKNKQVHWSPSVEQMEKIHKVKVYPKETVSKEVFHIKQPEKQSEEIKINLKQRIQSPSGQKQQIPSHRYCWSCLKRITQNTPFSTSQRYFCSLSCSLSYQQLVNPIDLLRQIQETQDKYIKCIGEIKQQDCQDIDLQFQ